MYPETFLDWQLRELIRMTRDYHRGWASRIPVLAREILRKRHSPTPHKPMRTKKEAK